MNRYILAEAGIQVKEGIERFSGNRMLYQKYLYQFPEENYNEKLRKAIEKESPEAFEIAHILKGVSGNLSLNRLFEAIVPLVEALRREPDFEKARELLQETERVYEETVQAIWEVQD